MKGSKTMTNANIYAHSLGHSDRDGLMERQFERIAILDRGEAAMRLIRTVNELNRERHLRLSTVALFTEPDRQAMFVRKADDALCIGPATFVDPRDGQLRSSYQNRAWIERALINGRADAAWVSWGILAEEPWFADLCERLAIVFVGPDAAVLRTLDNKITVRQLAQQANVPLAPWSGAPVETETEARQHADQLGYPLMVKPVASSGEAGIRRVSSPSELASAFESTRDEARRLFGDPSVFLERVVDGAQHIEVQLIADNYRTTWAVGMCNCTVQRHGQGIFEESGSSVLLPEQERELREAAVRLCQLAGCQSAATVEFLYDPGQHKFWFLEAHSRLSAAHPLAEITTDLDLVKLQLVLARGGRLEGEPPISSGSAVEVHLYAQDPDKDLIPSPGRLELFRLAYGPGLRIDTGYEEGDIIHAEFDPALARFIAWGHDRQEALARLNRALNESAIVIRGGMSNKIFLLDLLNRPELDTNAIAHLDRLVMEEVRQPRQHADVALLQAAVEAYNAEQLVEQAQFYASAARGRPRARLDNSVPTDFRYLGQVYRFGVFRLGPQQYRVTTSEQRIDVGVERLGPFERRVTCSGRRYRVLAVIDGPNYYVEVERIPHRMVHEEGGIVRSPTPAVVVSVAVAPGDHVAVGDRLALVETMKMEMAITAPFEGRAARVFVTSNVQVDVGAPLVKIEPLSWDNKLAGSEEVRFGPSGQTTDHSVPIHLQSPGEVGASLLDSTLPAPQAGLPPQSRLPDGQESYMESSSSAQARRKENEDDPQLRYRWVLEALRCQMLGYDIDAHDARQLLDEQNTVYQVMAADDQELLREEDEILSIFADICSLFGHEIEPAEAERQGEQVHSAEQDLLSYLRSRDIQGEQLPVTFRDNLQKTLAHYGVKSLDPSTEIDESLLLIYKSHLHVDRQLAAIITILERRLEHIDRLVLSAGGEMHNLLDRLFLATQVRYPAVNDLAREVRFRYFDEPLFEQARNQVYDAMRAHLTYLAAHPTAADRGERISALVACPQPLQNLLTSRFPQSDDEARQLMLEVLMSRYYRIRWLEDFACTALDGQVFAQAAYDYEGAHIAVATMFARYEDLAAAAEAMSRFVMRFPRENDVVVDFYVWRSNLLTEVEATEQEIRTLLDKTNFTRRLHRIVVAISAPGRSLGMASTQHFTYRPGENGYQEERLYRGLHPMMGKRLHIWRLANFSIKRLPSTEDVYLFHAIARDNPKDGRLFALAEVRDVTPLRDEIGKIVQIPHLERMLLEALESIRLYQVHMPVHKRLFWNRVLLYVWPPLGLQAENLLEIMRKLWPATEGLGLERIVLHAKITEAGTGELRDCMLHISNPGGRKLALRVSAPIETPIATLSEYRQKVVHLRQRGLVYPYELIEMLTLKSEGTHPLLPPGDFAEYDLDEDNRLAPIDRPYGKNKAGIVVGVIRNYTTKYPQGMTRVILLGDPSRSMGSVAEPECRRINEALNLAERLQVPLEWITLSAGAKISMDSGTENMDWVARALRRIIEFTQAGGEINIIVNGINVGAQPYWNAESTMLMHTRGILIMTPNGAMVLTGKQSLDYSGGVSAEDNYGIGGYERIMGPNGQAQYFAPDLSAACQILMRHYEHTYVMPGERFPRRAQTSDPATRDVQDFPYFSTRPEDSDLTRIGDLFSAERNAGRKRAFDIRTVMTALIDVDHRPLERWSDMRDAGTVVVWDAHIGGYPVAMLGIESRPIPRHGFIPGDGPEQWTAGTLFPMSSKKVARTVNSVSGNRPLVVIANLSGFDGSPESMRNFELEYGAEIGRAVTNFKGPIVFCVVSRYHGGSFVVFSKALNENLEVAAVEGSYASVIGGVPAAAVVFAREVDTRTKADPRVKELQEQLAQANGTQKSALIRSGNDAAASSSAQPERKAALQVKLNEVTAVVHSEKVGEVASEFDHTHNVQRAQRVGSIDHVISPAALRPYLIDALERGIQRELQQAAH
jgi:acetyl/propionyl-CoA carboxylase alpha subunit/acetyl-CoA carboxylase carboxyltransferase component